MGWARFFDPRLKLAPLSSALFAIRRRRTVHRLDAQEQGSVMPSLSQVVVWIIVGLLGGSLAGLIITRERKGFGILRNLGIGLIGALVGGQLFRMLGIFPDLDRVAVSLRDVVAALIGSFLVLAVIGLYQHFRKSR